MAHVVMKTATLEAHDSDVHLSPRQYLALSLFSQLKKAPSLEKFPGAMVIRRYRKGEELFRQGESGWTAYYILSLDDVLAMQQMRLESTTKKNEKIALQLDVNRLREEARRRQGVPEDDDSLKAATVHIATLPTSYSSKGGIGRMLSFTSRPKGASKNREGETFYQPAGGPKTISFQNDRSPLFEGDLFGEMSCLYRTPRSGTVVANRDCYMLEFLRNILDAVHRDPAYKKKADEIYLNRVFEHQIRKMSIFADLSKDEFEEIRTNVELVSFDADEIIFDEFERSESMYLVRQGLIKVMKNMSHLVSTHDVTDWVAFARNLRQGESLPGTPAGKLWGLLSERAQAILRAPELEKLGPADRYEVIFGVNDVLKERKMAEAPEFKPITDSEAFDTLLPTLPEKKQQWTDPQIRQHNRLLLEVLCPAGLRQRRKHAGVETILSYVSVNEYFGEMGLMLNQPRSATCIAFSHPNHEGTIELVKIPSKTFWKLIKMSAPIRERVKKEIATRRRQTIAQLARPVWEEANQVQFSDKFADLGLIQGQRLMLIDLDRCTRCDECVKACVNTHTDGNSRLFLDGPRFGKYLVPTACRSCLDPVCMIPCPVASIHRGDNKEIIIEDWCIGCSACAEACPYGSIQMHDLGLLPESVAGWRWLPSTAKAAQGEWMKPNFRDSSWQTAMAPFFWNRGLQDRLRDLGSNVTLAPINFRCAVDLERKRLRGEIRFKIELVSLGSGVRAWVNGIELTPDDKPRRGRYEFTIPPVPKEKTARKQAVTDFLRVGRNVIAVQVAPTCKNGEVLMQLRADEVKRPAELPGEIEASVADEVIEKLVTHKAVVCDLCSSLPGQVPACVHACPHDAALRVDARFNFPSR